MDTRLSAHPSTLLVQCIDSPLISSVKHEWKRLKFPLTASFFPISMGGATPPRPSPTMDTRLPAHPLPYCMYVYPPPPKFSNKWPNIKCFSQFLCLFGKYYNEIYSKYTVKRTKYHHFKNIFKWGRSPLTFFINPRKPEYAPHQEKNYLIIE